MERPNSKVKNKTYKSLIQIAFLLQALSMKGCGEHDNLQLEPEDLRHQFLFTMCVLLTYELALCELACY